MNETTTRDALLARIERLEREVEEKRRIESVLLEDGRQLEELRRQLAESDEKFRAIFHSAIVGIAMTDGVGKFILANETWNRMLGYTDREMKALTNLDITHPDDIEISREYSRALIGGKIGTIRIEKRYITKDRSTLWVDLSISAVNLNDGLHFFGVATDITQKKLMEFELKAMATVDTLTGLLNRRGMQQILASEMSLRKRFDRPASLMVIDLDHFKKINDAYGHQAGDEVLSGIARLLESTIGSADRVARWGGEEFLLLATDATAVQAAGLAEKLRRAIASRHFAGLGEVTASIGVAPYRPDEDFRQWYERADQALYRAKRRGRNRVVVD